MRIKKLLLLTIIILLLAAVPAGAQNPFIANGKDLPTGLTLPDDSDIVHVLNVYWVQNWGIGQRINNLNSINTYTADDLTLSNLENIQEVYTQEQIDNAELIHAQSLQEFMGKMNASTLTGDIYNNLYGQMPNYWNVEKFKNEVMNFRSNSITTKSVDLAGKSMVIDVYAQQTGAGASYDDPQPIDLSEFNRKVFEKAITSTWGTVEDNNGTTTLKITNPSLATSALESWRKNNYLSLFPEGPKVEGQDRYETGA